MSEHCSLRSSCGTTCVEQPGGCFRFDFSHCSFSFFEQLVVVTSTCDNNSRKHPKLRSEGDDSVRQISGDKAQLGARIVQDVRELPLMKSCIDRNSNQAGVPDCVKELDIFWTVAHY